MDRIRTQVKLRALHKIFGPDFEILALNVSDSKKAKAILSICIDLPEPSLPAHAKYGTRCR